MQSRYELVGDGNSKGVGHHGNPGMDAVVIHWHPYRIFHKGVSEKKERTGWCKTGAEAIANNTNISSILDATTQNFFNLIPIVFVAGLILFIVTFLFEGTGEYGGGFVYGLRKWWWLILVLGFPLFLLMGVGFDWGMLIFILLIVLVVGSLFFWWMEHDFELPKTDPMKDLKKWLKENFKW